jgi:hypothetical protein
VLVGITVLALTLLGLAAATASGLSKTGRARRDMQYVADVQQVVDSLLRVGYGTVTTDSCVIRGRSIRWAVTTAGTNSQLVTIIVTRSTARSLTATAKDTLSLFLAKATPGS